MDSPYKNVKSSKWHEITKKLILQHPLSTGEIKEVALESWEDIFKSKIGKRAYCIGRDIIPRPQIMAFFLHELIPLEFERRHPDVWRKEKTARDKDLIYIPDDKYSVEIKTSSDPHGIFGNRSYAQKTTKNKKTKSGYYLAINFGKFTPKESHPKIIKIRFGWIDHADWIGQRAATGQQSSLSPAVEQHKLIEIYSLK